MNKDLFSLNEHWVTAKTRDKKNKIDLRYAVYTPTEKPVSRYLVFLNGRTEFVGKYNYFTDDLKLPDDCGIISLDHRGQGGSEGHRGYVRNYDDYANDIKTVLDLVGKDKPYMILAHSMGSLISLYGTLRGILHPEKLILLSPLLGLPNTPFPRKISRPISFILSHLGLGRISAGVGKGNTHTFEKNKLTSSLERYNRIQQAPYKIPTVRFGWIHATFKATKYIFDPENIAKISIPIFIMGSKLDRVVEVASWKQWFNLATPLTKNRLQLIQEDEGRHELLSEVPKVYNKSLHIIQKEIDTWLYK